MDLVQIAQMDVQQDHISLFRQFVSAASSNTLKDIQPHLEFASLVHNLCTKAPSMAQYLVQEILKNSTDDSQTENDREIPQITAKKVPQGVEDDQIATPQTAVFTPIASGGLLSPLSENDWREMILPKNIPTTSCTEQQQTDRWGTSFYRFQRVSFKLDLDEHIDGRP